MDYKIKLRNFTKSTDIEGINTDAISFILSKLIRNSVHNHFLHIATNDKEADIIQKGIYFFASDDIKNNQLEILSFPNWDCLPFDRASPKINIVSSRINCLHKLTKHNSDTKILVITTISSVLQKTVPFNLVKNLGFKISTGEEISIDILSQMLIDNGFSRVEIANNISEFAIRGNIVDIIISHNQIADDLIGYRLDFFGNMVEKIKVFDPLTQLTHNTIKEINLLPTAEINLNQKSVNNFKNHYRSLFGIPKNDIMYDNVLEGRNYCGMEHFLPLFYDQPLSNIFDYLQQPQISFSNQIDSLKNDQLKIIEEYYQARIIDKKSRKNSDSIYNPLPSNYLYLNNQEFNNELNKNLVINFLTSQPSHSNNRKIDLQIKPIPDFTLASRANKANVFELFNNFIQAELTNHKILLTCSSLGSQDRIKKILLEYNTQSIEIKNFTDIAKLSKNQIGLCILTVSNNGFYSNDIAIISESSLLGEKIYRQTSKKSANRIISEGINLQIGELVVHRYHGIGKFDGLHNIETSGIKNDFLKIIYAGNDALFVLVEDINLITRYGADNPLIQLDKLGNNNWKNRREKIKNKIKIAAEKLIQIAAERKIKKAPILIADQIAYEEFKANFNFEETEDQLRVISEIEEDFQKGSPMDRLICGDVGFGKTEIAMRAAFIAASNNHKNINLLTHSNLKNNNYQSAIITPTTLLCRQHYHNFIHRFKNTNIKIAQLSRMISVAESKQIKQDLEAGKIDIIIGTHSLLNKNIKFKKLGLLIVDEEQHFGVIQKERIKELKSEVHILTISATPIPRTLQMSLSGVKELSIISTPPIDRLAIRNYVMPYDTVIIREAILREYQRGGRTFFVVPRIQDIDQIYHKLVKQIPEVKIEFAHGQINPSNLDKIMNNFYDGKFDVLLSTTIIESGIDISTANTIIIYKAENFGLAQLYQLRGRVGRGKIRGYCYFTTKKNKISEIAKRKLQVLQNLDELGAGFSIASHDMDIRGSGNILGGEQSGHVRETGVELYQSMLIDAIKELKSSSSEINPQNINVTPETEEYTVQIKLGISLLIPENYISDLSTRMQFYKRISNINTKEEQEQIAVEMIDRFGKLTIEIENLLQVAYLKNLCKKLNIEKLENTLKGILISFKKNHFSQGEKLLEMIFSSKNQIQLQTHKVLFLSKHKTDNEKLQNSFLAVNKISLLLQ